MFSSGQEIIICVERESPTPPHPGKNITTELRIVTLTFFARFKSHYQKNDFFCRHVGNVCYYMHFIDVPMPETLP